MSVNRTDVTQTHRGPSLQIWVVTIMRLMRLSPFTLAKQRPQKTLGIGRCFAPGESVRRDLWESKGPTKRSESVGQACLPKCNSLCNDAVKTAILGYYLSCRRSRHLAESGILVPFRSLDDNHC